MLSEEYCRWQLRSCTCCIRHRSQNWRQVTTFLSHTAMRTLWPYTRHVACCLANCCREETPKAVAPWFAGECDAFCQQAFAVYSGSDWYGNDFPGSPFPTATAGECQESCFIRPDCQAFTFVGVNGACSFIFNHSLPTASALTPLPEVPLRACYLETRQVLAGCYIKSIADRSSFILQAQASDTTGARSGGLICMHR